MFPVCFVTHIPGRTLEFYESDCQGQFSSLLIAFSYFPLQSAPSDPKRTIADASGWAVQSSVANSCSVFSIDPCRRLQAARRSSRRRRPWFYLRLTRRRVAITLIRVMRESLWLGECLGETDSRAETRS